MNTTIIFRPELFTAVKSYKKTVTRRIQNEGDSIQEQKRPILFGMINAASVYSVNGHERWREKTEIACRDGRTKPADGRLFINRIGQGGHASLIRDAEAIREGFASAKEFIQHWINLNGENSLSLPTWRIEFTYIPKGGYSAGILADKNFNAADRGDFPLSGNDIRSFESSTNIIEAIVDPRVYMDALRWRIIDLALEINMTAPDCAAYILQRLRNGRKLHEIFAITPPTDVK